MLSEFINPLILPRSSGGYGAHLLLCRPGEKVPWDLRTPSERRADTRNGLAKSGWASATSDPNRLASYMSRAQRILAEEQRELQMLEDRAGVGLLPSGVPVNRIGVGTSSFPPRLSENKENQSSVPVVAGTALSVEEISHLMSLRSRAGFSFNVALEVGRSRMLVVDCDTPGELETFRSWAAARSGDNSWLRAPLTVQSPGKFDAASGEWSHRGGGHVWFLLPDDYSLPEGAFSSRRFGQDHGDEPFDIFAKDHSVLIPPSIRQEGRYVYEGEALLAPPWLLFELDQAAANARAAAQRLEYRSLHSQMNPTPEDLELETWYKSTPWSALLGSIGWWQSGVDSCGCPVWARPGGSSTKSATAHEPGCSLHIGKETPPIHFWTTQPGEKIQRMLERVRERNANSEGSMSKLDLLAALEYSCNLSSAREAAIGSELGGRLLVDLYAYPGFVTANHRPSAWPGDEGRCYAWLHGCWRVAEKRGGVWCPVDESPSQINGAAPVVPLRPKDVADALVSKPEVGPRDPDTRNEAGATAWVGEQDPVLSFPGVPVTGRHRANTGADTPRVLSIDIETCSNAELGSRGVYLYAEDPSFDITLIAFAWGTKK